MIINKYAFPLTYLSDKHFKEDLNKIVKIHQSDVSSLSNNDLNLLIFLYERSALSCRRLLEENGMNDEINAYSRFSKYKEINDEVNDSLPVDLNILNYKDDYIFHIHTPFTFKRGMRESFTLADYLSVKISHKVKEIESLNINNERYTVYLIRVTSKYNKKMHADNDNLEASELINVIFSKILKSSDNPLRMSVVSDMYINDDEAIKGFHIVLIPHKYQLFHAEELLQMIYSLIPTIKIGNRS